MPSRLAILCCSTAFLPAEAHGGLPYSTFNLCKALIRAGADVRVVTSDRNGTGRLDVPKDCWTAYDGVPVWYARTAPGPFLFAASARRAVYQTMPMMDCVMNSGTLWVHSGWLAWRAARRFRKPSLSYIRGLLHPWAFQFKPHRKQLYWRLIGKRVLQDSSAIVALTENERRIIREMKITTRIEVIPNGAAVAESEETDPPDRAWLDATCPALRGRRYVLFLGRVHEIKGIDVLLPAIADFLRQNDQIAFVIAGPIDPLYRRRWNELVRVHALEDKLILPGTVSGRVKTAWLRHAALFVLPSYSEGLPVAALEALWSGCPVIVTKECDLPEIQSAGAGIVIDPDVGQLVDAMRTILGNEEHRRLMAERARALARETFDWDMIAARTLALCRELTLVRTDMSPTRPAILGNS